MKVDIHRQVSKGSTDMTATLNRSRVLAALIALPLAASLAAPASAQGFWEGAWAGVHLGRASSNHDFGGGATYTGGPGWFPLSPGDVVGEVDWPGQNVRGGLAGVQVGYNVTVMPSLLAGVQADLSFANITYENTIGIAAPLFSTSFTMEPRRFLTLAARLGFVPREDVHLYGLVGWSRASFRSDLETTILGTALPSDEDRFTMTGLTVGGGIETRVGTRTSVGLEYRYTNLGRHSFIDQDFGGLLGTSYNAEIGFDARVHSVRMALNYRF
jgi:outer membrane immunogenic protein